MVKRIALICFITAVSYSVIAQNLSNQRFRYLTPKNGLSQSNVTSIIQDAEGFMWFGTSEGLNRYDGENIVVYLPNPGDSTSILYDEIESLYVDSNDQLWIGTDGGGLNLYDPDIDGFIPYTAHAAQERHSGALSENTINDLLEDSRGNFWIATFSGLNIMNRETGTFKHFFHDPNDPKSINNNNIVDLYEDSHGILWIGTAQGLNKYNYETNTFKHVNLAWEVEGLLRDDYIEIIFEDSKGRLLIGTETGLKILDRENEMIVPLPDNFPHGEMLGNTTILSIFEDHQGVLWIGTENEGLIAIDLEKKSSIRFLYSLNNPLGINNSSIYSLYESRDKMLWIGTYDGGVNILDRRKKVFEHFNQYPGHKNTLSHNSVISFIEDGYGNFWIGTDGGGLNRFDRETNDFFHYSYDPDDKNGLPSDVVLDMDLDASNNIWIGTYRGGLSQFDVKNQTFRNYLFDPVKPNGLSHNEIFTVLVDREGTVWAGTNGRGLNRLMDGERGIFKQYHSDPEDTTQIRNNYIRDIFEDRKGRLWIGTHGRGIVKMDTKTEIFTDYNLFNEKLNSNVVFHIFEDQKGNIWAGTKGGGLAYFDEKVDRFISYTINDGLPNNVINGILEDDYGNLWMSTNHGLSRFNPQKEQFENFGLQTGLQSSEFKPGAAYEDSDGYFYFGGVNGFNRFHPDSVRKSTYVAPIVFTDFQVFNKSVGIGGDSPLKKHINKAEKIVLPYTASVITFKYAALDYSSGSNNSFSYKLTGFDNDWNEVGATNTATYTNLDPGEYMFVLKSSNRTGIEGDEIRNVQLVITPPFWRTNWFYFLSLLSVIGIIVGVFRYRTRQITERNKLLEQQVNERTAELRQSNQDLKQALIDLENTREELVQNAHKAGMADIATSVLHNIGNVLNSVTTSATISGDVLRQSKLKKLFKANKLLREHKSNLNEFLTNDPKGKKLPDYYLKLDELLKSELKILNEHNRRLERKVNVINDIIAAQQSYASMGQNFETVSLNQVLEDALTIFANSLERHGVTVKEDKSQTDPVNVQKTKLVHVILNVLKNAKESMLEAGVEDKIIKIKLWQDDKNVFLRISDNGLGVKKKHLGKIFNHGFTTKKTGHGFGLHSSANYMTEMGGKIEFDKENLDSGASFIIRLPVADTSETEEPPGLKTAIQDR